MSDFETSVVEELDIAIIGMAGRFPGARNIDEFWQNLRDGVESISFFSDEQVEAAGVDPALLNNPHYVKAGGVLQDIELFDASFFGFYPREAEIMDPQHRLFLECAWKALENAGYVPGSDEESTGVYAGISMNGYLLFNLLSNPGVLESTPGEHLIISNDKDFLPTRVSYKLNLTGPSINVQSACSTSLVATHLACQSLLNYQCDMALAGGVSTSIPQKRGYLYMEGGIGSPDGHCRAFDAQARGTISGSGMGIVVLKRLTDALADRDCIHAVIKGSAINNDGSLKVGYTAPSIDGQAKVIATAQIIAGVDPQAISYVEAHGTGTILGDPIEIAALTQVFRASTQAKGFCAIGSVKTNIGHLDAAAGVAGLIKTVLALKHKMIPPSLHYEQPNPKIDFENSPFYVNAALSEWKPPTDGSPRRAGVSSFGIGGTNVHAVLEQAPAVKPSGHSRPWQVLLLSAKTGSALDSATANLAQHLKERPDLNLADVAYTYQVGRKTFDYRRMTVCRDLEDAVLTLETLPPQRVFTAFYEPGDRPVTFMFTGLGDQYVDMALELYRVEPTFRAHVDHCSELVKPHLGLDLRDVLYPNKDKASAGMQELGDSAAPRQGLDLRQMLRRGKEQVDEHTQKLNQTFLTHPALFVLEYALAQLWIEWGIRPQAMIGYSIGEYVAACLAGVFSLEQALSLVAQRAQMIHKLPGGAMLAVPLSEAEVQPLLTENLSLSAVTGPSLCVISGSIDAVDKVERRLTETNVACRRLQTSHAFHSNMMKPIAESLTELVETFDLQPPQIPYVSNVTGTWITAAQATDPRYWARHGCQAVRFADGVGVLLKEPGRILLEVGPGRTLNSLIKQHPDCTRERVVLSSVRYPHDRQSDVAFLLDTLGTLWLAGAKVDWSGFYAHERRHRLPLPTYPFERQRYWIEPGEQPHGTRATRPAPTEQHKNPDIAEWFYLPSWKRSNLFVPFDAERLVDRDACWLLFDDGDGLGAQMARRLTGQGQDVVTVTIGDRFDRLGDGMYAIDPRERDHYDALIQALCAQDKTLETVVHLWGVASSDSGAVDEAQARGFYSLLFLAQALGKHNVTTPLQIGVVSSNLQEVTGEQVLRPEKATVMGPCRVIPQEYLNITCRSVDIIVPTKAAQREKLVDRLIAEFTVEPPDVTVAYRGNHRWVQIFEPLRWDDAPKQATRLREKGVYLITGGLGRIGLVLAEHLAQTLKARLILMGRSALPDRSEWEQWLAAHDDQDATSRKIQNVQALEALGADVMIASADVANLSQMQELIRRTYNRFGALHGVIHAAGNIGKESMTMIQDTSQAVVERQFQAKVHGTLVLEKVLQGRELDFCLLQSSLSSVLGGLGFAAYAAANCFMDALAHKHSQADGTSWISTSWDGWQFGQEEHLVVDTTLADMGITPEQGAKVFDRVLSLGHVPYVVVSIRDLQARIEQWVKLQALPDVELGVDSTVRHPRPGLQTVHVPPRNELEETIVAMWQKILGIEQVGIHDNFFELGGHSLLATQLISRLRDTFQARLSLRDFFESPTVAGLAENIETFRWTTQDLQIPSEAAAGDREEGEL